VWKTLARYFSGFRFGSSLLELGGKVDDLPASVSPGQFGKPVAQLGIPGLVLRKRGLREGVVGTPVFGMRTGVSHSYNHGGKNTKDRARSKDVWLGQFLQETPPVEGS
jgi:hypothetical protein